MQHYNFKDGSEMVTFAAYHADDQLLYLTYKTGETTIVYQKIPPALYEELITTAYPDVCIRFKIQANHSFRRVEPVVDAFNYTFRK